MKCKKCGAVTKNNDGSGNCLVCVSILKMVEIFETTLNMPNINGQVRKVKLSVNIKKV